MQFLETFFYIAPNVNSQCSPIAFGKNCKVAASLRRFHHSECVLLLWHDEIGRLVTRDLKKHAAVGPAFVGLSG